MSARGCSGPLALLVAAAGLAAGCLDTRVDEGSVAVYWTYWSHSLGDIGLVTDTSTVVCARAGVDQVRITLTDPDGVERDPVTVACITPNDVSGVAFVELITGTWGYRLEGRRAYATAYEASGTFDIQASRRVVVDVRAAPPLGRWDVVVTYTTSGCAVGDRLEFDLLSTAGSTATVAWSTDDPAVNPSVVVPCSLAGQVSIPSVAAGPYAFSDWVHVDSMGAPVAWSTCRAAWTQPDTVDVALSVNVTAGAPSPLPLGNDSVCP